ncbi:Peroxisomal membrane protein PER10 [Candida viswanathii]|uniref:Peroxisomal membrane protein PEX14 n=1 Tax=Candida viswanathii TaxID=5486 RepID=A0A367YC98_9ASCO|nr:Peroxisomal membrane protein PER10 [Candida viswanathii]
MNDELINSAVSFLKDPQVASSPLTKKVEFLESKGLNQQEIEEALKRANDSAPQSVGTSQTPSYAPPAPPQGPPIDYYNAPPPIPERSWKDYFIMATATAGITYGFYQVLTRYLIPSIVPPTQSSIDQDKETINEEFMKIDKVLEQLTIEQQEIKTTNEAKLSEIDTVIDNVNDFLNKYNKDKLKFDDDLRLMKLEIENLSNSVEKNMKLTKENINDELGEVSQELQSLKNLIKARSSSNNQSNGGAEPRKIAPVSSIPSASEILKRARAKNSESPTAPATEPAAKEEIAKKSSQPPNPAPVTAPVAAPQEPKVDAEKRSEKTTAGGVTAAGIPLWQIQAKEQEEQEEQAAEKDTEEKPGVPEWQQSAADLTKSEEEIKEKIKSVGVPSWQLNANASSGNSAASSPGIPSWQQAASSSTTTSSS